MADTRTKNLSDPNLPTGISKCWTTTSCLHSTQTSSYIHANRKFDNNNVSTISH